MTTAWLESRKLAANRPEKRYDVTVAGRPGLMVRVHESGVVSFRFRYRRGSERRVMVLGEFGIKDGISLADAHEMHQQAQREIARGLDPIEEREKRQQAAERARAERAGADTVAHMVEQFVHRRLRGERWDEERGGWVRDEKSKTKARKRPDAAAALLGYVPPDAPTARRKNKRKPVPTFLSTLGHIKAPELTRRQIIAFLDGIVDRGAPITGNRVHALLKQLCDWAAAKDIIPASPLAGVERPGGAESSRTRALSAEEIRAVWTKLDSADMAEPTRLALKLLLVTGQRRGEITLAAWSHFDLTAKLWTIPVALQKSSHSRRTNLQPHVVPLSPLALALLGKLRVLSGESPYVLPAHASQRHSKPYSSGVLTRAVKKNQEHFGIPHWTPHDLRRTCRTGLAMLKVPPHVAERVINHAPPKMDSTYDLYAYIDEKRDALDKWAEHVRKILEGKDKNETKTADKTAAAAG